MKNFGIEGIEDAPKNIKNSNTIDLTNNTNEIIFLNEDKEIERLELEIKRLTELKLQYVEKEEYVQAHNMKCEIKKTYR